MDAGTLEMQLRELWKTGYREIKWAMIDLYKVHGGKYAVVAEHYMRTSAPEGMMVAEFESVLAEPAA